VSTGKPNPALTGLAFALSALACDRLGHKLIAPFLAAGAGTGSKSKTQTRLRYGGSKKGLVAAPQRLQGRGPTGASGVSRATAARPGTLAVSGVRIAIESCTGTIREHAQRAALAASETEGALLLTFNTQSLSKLVPVNNLIIFQ
jgi:hypothetical protein